MSKMNNQTPENQWDQIGLAFVREYYNTYDTNPKKEDLANYYHVSISKPVAGRVFVVFSRISPRKYLCCVWRDLNQRFNDIACRISLDRREDCHCH